MSQANRVKMLATVRKMFSFVDDLKADKATKGLDLDEDGVPKQLKALGEEVYAPEVKFNVPGKGPHAFTGGKKQYYEYNKRLASQTEGNLDLQLLDILVGEKHAAALVRYSDQRGDQTFSWLRINAFEFNESCDQIVQIRTYEHDQYGVDAWYSASLT
ncbi:hypothetical protein ACM61V_16510 [Sphingomonas sp. TX0543]|uniref:hypothetical protein n=1 Tax=Sphingomonas sp. TX0543 TaxID=3399682 RepID=UPI003AFB7E00